MWKCIQLYFRYPGSPQALPQWLQNCKEQVEINWLQIALASAVPITLNLDDLSPVAYTT